MKQYVFELTYGVVEEVVVEADDYEKAIEKLEDGEGEIRSEYKEEWDFKCIKMPENLEEENADKYESVKADNEDYFVQEREE